MILCFKWLNFFTYWIRVVFILSSLTNLKIKYNNYIKHKIYISFFLVFLMIIFSFISIKVGATDLSWKDIFMILYNHNSSIIWDIRIPRILVAIIVGCSMGIEGAVMQCILRNPLASPYTMGISQGAAFGVAFAIVVLGIGTLTSFNSDFININNPYITTLFAFLGSMISVVLIILLSKLRSITPTAMILAGVAMSSLFSAGTMLLQYFANTAQLSTIIFWTFGDLERAVWNDFWIILLFFIFSLIYFVYHIWDYNSLEAGDEIAKSLGVDTHGLRIFSLLVSSVTAAISVAFVGIIGFVGLVAPHIMKRVVGMDYRFLIPCSAFLGAIILLIADLVSRLLLPPLIIPVGILTSFLGVPIFIYILIKTEG